MTTPTTTDPPSTIPVALVTGGSSGLGAALVHALVRGGWRVVTDARDGVRLARTLADLPPSRITGIAGDVADPRHRQALADAVADHGGLDLLVNNASVLGPSPLPPLADLPLEAFERILVVNTIAPLALIQLVLPQLHRRRGVLISISSDAAVEAYPGWGGYGASKAALDRLGAVLGVEHPALSVYAFDPGDMNTEMHQQAFPGEDISDRPSPDSVVPTVLALVRERPASGRYRGADLLAQAVPTQIEDST